MVHPNGSARPWVSWCGYSVLTSTECVLNLSIAVLTDKGLVRVGHTMVNNNNNNNNVRNNNPGSMMRLVGYVIRE